MKILEEFQKAFDDIVMPYINSLNITNQFTEPLFYTLEQKSNKFRSGTALISAKLCGGTYEDVLPIAAAVELIHNSIIIQDDIADSDIIRRGKQSAWRKYGICYALHSSLYIIPECLRILRQLKSNKAVEIESLFMNYYQDVYKAQSGQILLNFRQDISYQSFLDVHLGKTALGRWAIISPAIFYSQKEYINIFDEFAKKLGDAGSIKNDIENFLESGDYEPFCTDIRLGSPTYPTYYYFSKCNENERDKFLRLFGKNRDTNYSELRQSILGKGTVEHCIKKINDLVNKAICLLDKFNYCDEKEILIAWANNHRINVNG